MSTLTSTYSLAFDALVVVKARARNSVGWSTLYSNENTSGAKIRRIPD